MTVLTPASFTSLKQPKPSTPVNIFNLVAFIPPLNSISANTFLSKLAGRDAQKQLVLGKNTPQFSSKQILNLHTAVHLLTPSNGCATEGRALHEAEAAPAHPTHELQPPSATGELALGLGDCKKGIFFSPPRGKKKKHSKEVQGKKYVELVTRLKQSKKHLVLIKSHLMDCFFPQLYFSGVIRIIQVDTNPSETISVLP